MSRSSRRSFLRTAAAGSAVMTFGGVAPAFLKEAARVNSNAGRRLVVVELAGGNDGLNTVVPYTSDEYRKLRPELALSGGEVLKIDDQLGLNPALRGFADLLEAGHLSIVQGVGYDNPNRSHFESMDIWHTCQRKDEIRESGWLGRYLEFKASAAGTDPLGIHLGGEKQPFALMSRSERVPSIRSLNEFRIRGAEDEAFRMAVRELAEAKRQTPDDLLDFVQSSTSSAIAASERIAATGRNYRPAVTYPETALAQKLQTIAQLIDAELTSQIFYVRLDGFDTHAQQAGAHTSLLRQLGDAVFAFLTDVSALGQGEHVTVMCFSEFGRRVAENASAGTDHGTAGPMFLAGTQVQSGLIGQHPDLTDLQDGDLRHHTDFRQVYATVLEDWLGCDSESILLGRYDRVAAFRQA
jgi:uncharacterized protein (DUF1501 family)